MQAKLEINKLTFQLQAENAKDLFQQVAQIQEVFEAETQCGLCQSEDIRYGYREVGDYKYYELRCGDCAAQFKFGQKKQGGALFPKRTEDGKPLANGGWAKYEHSHDDDAPRPRQQQNAPVSRPAGAPGPAIANYQDWDAAERDPKFGKAPLRVGGVLFHVPPGKNEYVEAPQRAQ